MSALGFRDKVNCFAVEDHSSARLDEIVSFARSDSREAERLAQAGQDMIRERHHAAVRARQFLSLLEALCRGRLAGSQWRDGRQVILEPGVPVAS